MNEEPDEPTPIPARGIHSPEKCILHYAILLALIAGGWFLWSSVEAARERARRADCAGNLRQLGLGLHMYSGDHRERFPDALKDVMPYVKQTELFVCPSEKRNVIGRPYPHEVGRYGSYYYISGLTEATDSDHVHMFDLPSTHKGEGGNILFVGGYIQWCPINAQEGSSGFWDILASSGITWDVIKNADGRTIYARDLTAPQHLPKE